MSDSTLDDNDLTSTQEYLIAGIVILLFGSLYWFLNHGNPLSDAKGLNAYSPPPVISESTGSSSGTGEITKPASLAEIENEGKINQKAPEQARAIQHQIDQKGTETTLQTQSADMKTTAEESDKPSAQETETTKVDNKPVEDDKPKQSVADTQTEDSEASKVETAKTQEDTQQADTTEESENTSDSTTEVTSTQQAKVADTENASPAQQEEATDTEKTGELVVMDATVSQLNDDLLNGRLENPLVLETINFDPDSTEVKMKSDHQIEAIAGLLQKYPDSKVLIRGHTDAEGVPENNKRLSLMRATAMGRKLVEAGANAQSIIIMGMGATEPLTSNSSEEGRRKNRRIDISITQ